MRVRITRQPPDDEFSEVSGLSSRRFEVGQVYEVGPTLGTLLIVSGYALPEMRVRDQAADRRRRRDD